MLLHTLYYKISAVAERLDEFLHLSSGAWQEEMTSHFYSLLNLISKVIR
jgi:hypothetical protein